MKLTVIAALCLVLLFHIHLSMAKKRLGLNLFKKTPKTKTNVDTKSKGKQQFNQGSYPQQPDRPGGNPYQGGYPHQPGNPAGSYPAAGYPAQGYPYGGGYGGYAGHGGYPGGHMNYNPNNKIPSPHYGGSFGYGAHGFGGGSPFSHSVQGMGVYPQDRSRGFGRSAAMAAAGGAMAGMALGYGLGRFPRPHFPFHNPQEEYYYNHYMYRRYGVRSTDTNDYGRDYRYSQPPQTYNSFMDSCMKRRDLLPVENRKPKLNPAAVTTTTITSTTQQLLHHILAAATQQRATAAQQGTPRPLHLQLKGLSMNLKPNLCLQFHRLSEKQLRMRTMMKIQSALWRSATQH
ncbi:unnamed protein product [Pleuronectes platessa]|uniref:Prion protein n=1 Tax=Pleuronectes platessa TaxID=8262 RepID=A0A9N7Z1J5_PLEPL|nr:unnamed protein product [Pleuronectes platessa]